MKFLVVLLCVALSVTTALGGLTEEQKNKMKEDKQKCIEETGVDASIIETAKADKTFPDSNDEKFKCYCKCLLKKMGVMNEDGTFNEEVFRSKMPDDIPKEKIDKVVDACKGETGENECDTGYKLLKCYMDKKDFKLWN